MQSSLAGYVVLKLFSEPELAHVLSTLDRSAGVNFHPDGCARGNRQALCDSVGHSLLVGALAAEGIPHGAVAFVAGILVELVARLLRDSESDRKRRGVHRGIVHADAVVDHLRIDAR